MLLLFDLDGTLVDSHEAICMALNDTLEHFGLEKLDYSVSRKFIGLEFAPLLQKLGIKAGAGEIMEVYRRFYFGYAEKYQRVYDGITGLLGELKNMVKLSLITNKGRRGTDLTMKSTGIFDFFDYIITENDVKSMKPSCESLEKVIGLYSREGIKLDKRDCLMVGDSPVDCEFASNCGLDYAFAGWGFFSRSDLPSEPLYSLNRPFELIDIIGASEQVEIEITDELDLHAFSPKDISRLVPSYIIKASEKGYKTVRIIHGKGIGVQREIVRKILTSNPKVRNFYDAQPDNGGRGATIAELK
ncbi:MAG: HAD-IA family hydrolase [Brevinematales bacterium]|jgi:HAD superfamily hydrolase (TIGR01549 family)